MKGFPSRQWHELGWVSVHHEDDGVLAGLAWVSRWPLGREVGHVENRKWEWKEGAGWAGLRFQLGFGPLPNRNSDDFYVRHKILEHFTIQRKICISMKCNK
jgi:hypothetical protein